MKETIISASISLITGLAGAFIGAKTARKQIDNENSNIRIQLFEHRHKAYLAFKKFIAHAAIHETYDNQELTNFLLETEKFEFLFEQEIRNYHREIIANAIAIRGITLKLPCEDKPVAGGMVGYFKGSTHLTDINELRAWFIKQHKGDLFKFFHRYLDYSAAGVDPTQIKMTSIALPDPPIVRRRIK